MFLQMCVNRRRARGLLKAKLQQNIRAPVYGISINWCSLNATGVAAKGTLKWEVWRHGEKIWDSEGVMKVEKGQRRETKIKLNELVL